MIALSNSLTALTATLLVTVQVVHGFWRLPCQGRTAVARIDPLAQFGKASAHAHVIHGGNSMFTSFTFVSFLFVHTILIYR